MLTITPQAAEQIRRAAQQSGAEGMALRVAARQNENGKVEYGMGFDDRDQDDAEYVVEGIRILMWRSHEGQIKGVKLDFVETNPGEFRFVFIPPERDEPE